MSRLLGLALTNSGSRMNTDSSAAQAVPRDVVGGDGRHALLVWPMRSP
jgi:hypothetical protein